MNHSDRLGESAEMYLETILLLEKNGKVRSVDIAKNLNVSKPSVNKAMNVLKEMGFVTQETYGEVHLTEAGRQKASDVYNRHEILCDFLEGVLHVSRENAENDACKIEHVVCDETINKIKEFMKK